MNPPHKTKEDVSSSSGDVKSSVPVPAVRARKGGVQVVQFSVVSRYDKQVLNEFDEYASNSIRFEIGDMVWGKVKSHPWWPGQVYSEALASPAVRKTRIQGQVLVAFFGDSSYGWFYPADLLPFDVNFEDKRKQRTSNRNFGKAVEEAVDEATRRSALGFACRCRNQDNFRDSGIEGYFCVDVCGYEPGSVYSADQIRKARDNFKPRKMVDFLNQLAVSPTGNDDQGIEFMKDKAAVIAYRTAVYEEVDETYDQAFGHAPNVRTSLRKTLATSHSPKVPIRAPLSGPLVIAEALGKGKGFVKPNKGKAQAKKDQYLLKRRDEAAAVDIDVKVDHSSLGASEYFDPFSSQPAKSELRDSFSAAHLLETTNTELQGKDKKMLSDIGEKKLKIHKRTVGELNSVNSTAPENEKKKQKKELFSSQNMQMHPSGGKNGSSVDNMAGKYGRTPVASRDSRVDPQKKEDSVNNTFSPDSVAAQKTSKEENIQLKLPQLLHSLKSLALDPFDHLESSPTVTQQIVLRFRSLVFQKSLVPLPPANSEPKETRRSKPAAAVVSNNISAEDVREPKSVKTQKLVVRPDDPAKGGRKRGPSDRQDEIAAGRKKYIDAKLLTDQRTAEKSFLMQRRDVKETSASTKKSVKPELVKKVEPLSRASDPTMLVMKFPLHGTLPSINELKARFICFGQLDHSACRVFWKSLTCRVVFKHKADAQAAYRYAAASSNMFGTSGVRCYLREMEVAAVEQEPDKVQRDEVSMSTSQLRDSTAERRFVAPHESQTAKQSGAQVKSILKRATSDETSGDGGIRATPRVKFMLGGEENSKEAEQLMIGNKNNTNAIFADGGTSTSRAIDFNSKNFQNITSSSLPPLLPTPTIGAFQFPGPLQSNLQYTEEAPRTNHKFKIPTADLMTPSTPNIDISEQMINLLTKCNDIVNNVTAFLGYSPFHPL